MSRISNLNVSKSFDENKLVFSENWQEKMNTIVLCLIFTTMAGVPFAIFIKPDQDQINPTAYLLFFFTALGLYFVYRTLIEKRLIKISSKYGLNQNKELIMSYCKDKYMEEDLNSKDLIIFSEADSFHLGDNARILRIFLLKNNDVYFTVIKDNSFTPSPVFTSYFLKKDLKHILT